MPEESTIYVADLLHFPYGPRYQEEVKRFAIHGGNLVAFTDRRIFSLRRGLFDFAVHFPRERSIPYGSIKELNYLTREVALQWAEKAAQARRSEMPGLDIQSKAS